MGKFVTILSSSVHGDLERRPAPTRAKGFRGRAGSRHRMPCQRGGAPVASRGDGRDQDRGWPHRV